jgi:phytoene dehydrogenase-like protein
VLRLIGEHVENLPGAVISRRVVSPAELERRNPNFVRGDPYAGGTDLDQSYVWHPLPSYASHVSPVEALYQCGTSTYLPRLGTKCGLTAGCVKVDPHGNYPA